MGHPWSPRYPLITTTPNAFPTRKSLHYPIYSTWIDPKTHVRIFIKINHANGENSNFELALHYSGLNVPTFVEDNPFGTIISIIEDDIEYKTLFEKMH
jgi:hypothetical protein